MTWGDILDRLESSGLNPVEEIYMENYGKILTAQRPEFRDRNFRCTFGAVKCAGLELEFFVFADRNQTNEFLEVAGTDPWWVAQENVVVHFPECDPAIVAKILNAMAKLR